ncbi:MAG TPA: VWA domain-containing protein [Gemmatimonadales bacterium]|nr:VWA domain-containing protein [Gemmatimonadales bacterium]
MNFTAFFDRPWMLAVAPFVALVIVLLVLAAARRRRVRLSRLGDRATVSRLTRASLDDRSRARAIRLGLAALLGGVALAGPRWGTEESVVRGEGIDMVLALDASLSMLAEDESPSRLERMKQEVRRLLDDSRGDRVALLAFAGRSYILTPLTIDEGAIDLFLENLDPSVVGQAGSSMSRTIRQATDLLRAAESGSDRAIVVMSDGESFDSEQEIREAAAAAAEAGIALVTVGFGTQRGATIPEEINGRQLLKRDQSGEIVVTRYTPGPLQVAAEAAGGTFVAAPETDKAGRIRAALRNLRTQSRALDAGRTRKARFQLFLFPAFLLVALDTWLADSRRRRKVSSAQHGVRFQALRSSTASLLIILLVMQSLLPMPLYADPVDDALTAFREGRYADAAELYRRAIDDGDERPEVLYNYATALLAADSLQHAMDGLERVARPAEGELRHRALFNLGLGQLQRGLTAEGDEATQALDAALESYRSVLLARPGDEDAKWNYELALREKERQGGGGGGGGDSESESGGGGGGNEGNEAQQPAGGLGQQQAEQLLGSAAREEEATQGKRQDRSRPQPPPSGPDW